MEIGSVDDDAFSAGDKGFGWCWGDTNSDPGDATAWVSYGNVKAVDDSKVMLEETNGYDPTVKLIL